MADIVTSNHMKARVIASLDPATGEEGILHGGRLIEARRDFPDAPEPFVDLSTGINPVPYPMPELPPEAFARLPEPEEVEALQECAARAYGCGDPGMVAAAAGTQLLIEILPCLFPARAVHILAPTYGEHAPAWARTGATIHEVGDFSALDAGENAVICNPNNPDGRAIDPAKVQGLARRLAGRNGILVVDEAFAEYAEQPLSSAPGLPCPGLVLLRSFGKAYGLAGLRLGFALASPSVAATIRAALGPWAVSGPALYIARRALADGDWYQATGARLHEDTARLDKLLNEAGLEVLGGTSLFRLARAAHAPEIYQRLGRAGLLVRRFEHRVDWLRFGLPPSEQAWARLEAALLPAAR